MASEGDVQLYRNEAATTVRALRQRVRWKPGKATAHLEKRKALGHLSSEVTVEDYNRLIGDLVKEEGHRVYLYCFGSERYYAMRGIANGAEWLVIATRAGIVETAFPPNTMDDYLNKRSFTLLGTIQEVLT
jgi:hypothetical protein